MQALKSVLDSQAVSVFFGTLPLLLTIAWGLLQSDRRLTRIEGKLDSIDSTLAGVRERLAIVETRIDRLDPLQACELVKRERRFAQSLTNAE